MCVSVFVCWSVICYALSFKYDYGLNFIAYLLLRNWQQSKQFVYRLVAQWVADFNDGIAKLFLVIGWGRVVKYHRNYECNQISVPSHNSIPNECNKYSLTLPGFCYNQDALNPLVITKAIYGKGVAIATWAYYNKALYYALSSWKKTGPIVTKHLFTSSPLTNMDQL